MIRHLQDDPYHNNGQVADRTVLNSRDAIREAGMEENTIFIFTTDHGHMINSHDLFDKQKPHEESIHVPFLIKYPRLLGNKGRTTDMLMNTPDIMPTLLSICNLPIPDAVEGDDLSDIITGKKADDTDAVLISCPHPFGQWNRQRGGKEYRGVRTKQYTYACDLEGPWLLYDNVNDPFQMTNLVNKDDYAHIQAGLHDKMLALLDKTNDDFLPGMEYIEMWGYVVDERETIPYNRINFQGMPVVE